MPYARVSEFFKFTGPNTVTNRVNVKMGTITFDTGTIFQKDYQYGGFNVYKLTFRNLYQELFFKYDQNGDIYVIEGTYKRR